MEQNVNKKISNNKEIIIDFSIILPDKFNHICKSRFNTEKTTVLKSYERLHWHH